MKTISYTESRANYARVLDDVVYDREEAIITRAGHEPVVIVSLADYECLRETAYLLRSPRKRPASSTRSPALKPAKAPNTALCTYSLITNFASQAAATITKGRHLS